MSFRQKYVNVFLCKRLREITSTLTSQQQPEHESDDGASGHDEPTVADLPAARIYARAAHNISRKDIDEHALHLLYRLSSVGCSAYLVGGAVRDLYLGKKPKDFDIATDARPSRVKKLFRNSRIIGRRFRIAHVYFPDGKIIEVATFRRGSQITLQGRRGLVIRDNEYGTPQEDALRRDLTINGLFYDIVTFSVIDHVGGVEDLQNGIIRTIGDPHFSFSKDPARMIRAQRHAARTGFEIADETLEAIQIHSKKISETNPSRLLEEILKDLRSGASEPYFRLIRKTGFLRAVLPALADQLDGFDGDHPFWRRMHSLDHHVKSGATYSTPVFLATLLHTLLLPDRELWESSAGRSASVWRSVMDNFPGATEGFRVSRRDKERVAQILNTQAKLLHSLKRGRLGTMAQKPYLLDALDFLEVDLTSTGNSNTLVKEWRRLAPVEEPAPRRRRRRPRAAENDETQDGENESRPLRRPRSAPARSAATSKAAGTGSAEAGKGEERPKRKRRRRRRRPPSNPSS